MAISPLVQTPQEPLALLQQTAHHHHGVLMNPQLFINKWLISQSRDLKTMTDVAGNPEEERHTDFYYQPWAQEAVCRYFYSKIQQKRQELDSALGVRN